MDGWTDDDLDSIGEAPLAPRALLDFEHVRRVCFHGVRSALGMVRRGALEMALPELTAHVRALEAVDPNDSTVDAWGRLGAVRGAVDMWRGEPSRPPQDCPGPAHMLHYCGAWAFAATCVAVAAWGVR